MSIFNIFIDILAFKSTFTLSFVFVLTILQGFFPSPFLLFLGWITFYLSFFPSTNLEVIHCLYYFGGYIKVLHVFLTYQRLNLINRFTLLPEKTRNTGFLISFNFSQHFCILFLPCFLSAIRKCDYHYINNVHFPLLD